SDNISLHTNVLDVLVCDPRWRTRSELLYRLQVPTWAATLPPAKLACVMDFLATQGQRETAMAGGTKPAPRTRKAERFQDGAKKSGGIRTTKHAGPRRTSKTPSREHIQSETARERGRAQRTGSTNKDQQANRTNVRE